MKEHIIQYRQHTPQIKSPTFVAPNAVVIGQVFIDEESSIWFGACIRGDEDRITVGKRTNIQDLTLLHTTDGYPVSIGNDVTIGHHCVIHGATLQDQCLIGMGSIIMDGATIGSQSIVGANALVVANTKIGSQELWLGSPAKYVRKLSSQEIQSIVESAASYVQKAKHYTT